MIKLKNLEANINGKTLFNIDDFTFQDGKKYILTGENGAGKSTLLKSFLGLNQFVKGTIISDKKITYQAQNPYIFKKTPRDNFKIIDIDANDIKKDLEYFDLDRLIDQRVESLSGGEKEKLVFLRSILRADQSLLLDEPFSQMDKRSRINTNLYLDNWLKEKADRMVIVICHGSISEYNYDYEVKIEGKQLILA